MDKRNIAEKEREKSVLGASDTPIGTRLGESPRALNNSDRRAKALPLNELSDGDVVSQLPPLNGEMFEFLKLLQRAK